MVEEPDRVAQLSDIRRLENELKALIAQQEERTERRIVEQGETTRRYFDIMVEKVEASVKLVAEVTAHHSGVLDEHESRLTSIEKRI